MKIRDALRDHSRGLCFLLAAILTLILSQRTILASVYPNGDGQGYAMRGFALYGYLHTGQWTAFWHLLSAPNQSICPLHYVAFFLLPQSLAGIAMYVLVQSLTTYLLLAAAILQLCRALNRMEWAPAIFIFCGVNNVTLTEYYDFYLDMEYLALGLFAVALQLTAWREKRFVISLLSGLALGLLFWMKPANALIFAAVFFLSEIFYLIRNLLASRSPTDRRKAILDSLRHWGYQGLGFIPVMALALFSGGIQTILQLIRTNEVNDTAIPVHAGILLRLLYFPLCLSFFYHVLVLAGLLLIGFIISKWKPSMPERKGPDFSSHLFIAVALAYLVWGIFFSFWIQAKYMRSLLPMLPICWISLFWLIEKRRLRVETMLFIAIAYTATAVSQKAFDLLGTRSTYNDTTYQLSLSSWAQMPSPWYQTIDINTAICDGLSQNLPPPGIICTNGIELAKELTWRLTADDLLKGEPPAYDVRLIFNFKGNYLNQTFVGAKLIVFENVRLRAYEKINAESLDVIQYGISEWIVREHCALPGTLDSERKEALCYFFLFPHPLTQAQVDAANKSEPFSKMVQENDNGSAPLTGPHFSEAEGLRLIKAWYDKRMGRAP